MLREEVVREWEELKKKITGWRDDSQFLFGSILAETRAISLAPVITLPEVTAEWEKVVTEKRRLAAGNEQLYEKEDKIINILSSIYSEGIITIECLTTDNSKKVDSKIRAALAELGCKDADSLLDGPIIEEVD